MLRTVVYLLASILLLTFLRSVIGLIARAFSEMLGSPGRSSAYPGRTPEPRAAGELKKDPVCGTFVPAATSIKKTVRGELVYFCSTTCRDKFGQT